nr:hypothetical protein [Brevundimonas diminuta]
MDSEALKATEAYSAARATHPRVSLDDMKAKISRAPLLHGRSGSLCGRRNSKF